MHFDFVYRKKKDGLTALYMGRLVFSPSNYLDVIENKVPSKDLKPETIKQKQDINGNVNSPDFNTEHISIICRFD